MFFKSKENWMPTLPMASQFAGKTDNNAPYVTVVLQRQIYWTSWKIVGAQRGRGLVAADWGMGRAAMFVGPCTLIRARVFFLIRFSQNLFVRISCGAEWILTKGNAALCIPPFCWPMVIAPELGSYKSDPNTLLRLAHCWSDGISISIRLLVCAPRQMNWSIMQNP